MIPNDVFTPYQSNQLDSLFDLYQRPSVIYKPILQKSETGWIAMYGGEIRAKESGYLLSFYGSGSTPEEAMRDFDVRWYKNHD